MRIALFHNLPSGGAKRAVYEWTRRLTTTHHIDVYTMSSANHDFCDIRKFVQEYHIFNFTPHKLFKSPLGRFNQLQRWRDLEEIHRINRHIAEKINAGSYDVVFVHSCLYTRIPSLLSFIQVPTVYYLHEPFGNASKRQFCRPYLKNEGGWRKVINQFDPFVNLYQSRLAKMRLSSINHADLLLANSLYTQKQMRLEYNVDSPVSYCGVDIENFYPIQGVAKENYIISVGELTPRKGFDFLIKSLAHLPTSKRPNLKLVCNWVNTNEKNYIQELANRYGVNFHIYTNLNGEQLRLKYNRAKLCVYAPVMEPFGLVPLEAMACGTPVVGVAEGGVCETVVDGVTGYLVKRNPVQFAEAIRFLLEDPKLRKQYGRQAREYVLDNWTWDKSVIQIEKHLCKVDW